MREAIQCAAINPSPQQLEHDPGDWDLRLQVIKDAMRAGDIDYAKRLVRESPEDIIPSDEITVRLQALLAGGREALSDSKSEDEVSNPATFGRAIGFKWLG